MTRKRVLCIEDNVSNMRLVGRIVEAEKHDFLSANDGSEALGLIAEERPDLILLDINIPGVDGFEIARRVKGDSALSAIPIIATTANVLVGDRERCLEAGCDAYLPKPLDVRELQDVLRAYLGRGNGKH
jgi:two-component system cell cycle response regulator DivK